MAKEKETKMQNQKIATESLPRVPEGRKNEKKVLKQAEINEMLWEAVDREATRLNWTYREVFEYGLGAFLLSMNPAEAKKLGITPKAS